MRWTDCAVQDLKKYTGLKASVDSIAERLEALEVRFTGINGANTTKMPTEGGGSRLEDYLLDNIAERERLKLLHEADKRIVTIIEKGLAFLNDTERLVLDRFFIHKQKDHVARLINELHIEQAQVYRIKDQALYKFTIHMYGIEEY